MADNKETNQTAEHQCHECAKFLKRDCTNMFPRLVKPSAKACGSFITPVSADRTYCTGWFRMNGYSPDAAIMICRHKDKCERFMDGNIPDGDFKLVEVEKCVNHGYPNYIRNEKNR